MKLRKSPAKPVTQQKTCNYIEFSVLPPEIVIHDAFNVIIWMSADICVVVHDELGWKNRTTWYNCRFSATSLALRVIFVRQKRPPIHACIVHNDLRWKNRTTCCNRLWRAGCSRLEYVDIRLFGASDSALVLIMCAFQMFVLYSSILTE